MRFAEVDQVWSHLKNVRTLTGVMNVNRSFWESR